MVAIIAIIGYVVVNRKIVTPIDRMASVLQRADDNSDLTLRVEEKAMMSWPWLDVRLTKF